MNANREVKSILYFSSVSWRWIKQRPQFIPYYLSQHNIDIDYVTLHSCTKNFRRNIQEKINDRLTVKDIRVLPRGDRYPIVASINKLFIKRYVNQRYDTIILTNPLQYKYIVDKITEDTQVIYECMDNMAFFYNDQQREILITEENSLCEKCDKIIVSSRALKNLLVSRNPKIQPKIEIIFNGVDQQALDKKPQYVELESISLTYIGTISEWLDFELLRKIATDNEECKIYLIGPIVKHIRNKVNTLPNNVIYIGVIEHERVIDYINASDIMIIPFITNELIKCVDPVKLYEYIAYSKPVLSAYWDELLRFEKYVTFYTDIKSCQEQLNKIKLLRNTSSINQEFINGNSWTIRVRKYLKVLEENKKVYNERLSSNSNCKL